MTKHYTIHFDREGKPFKCDTDKIPCGMSDWIVGVMVILGTVFAILDIVGMLIKI
jgi:hypothetical protein